MEDMAHGMLEGKKGVEELACFAWLDGDVADMEERKVASFRTLSFSDLVWIKNMQIGDVRSGNRNRKQLVISTTIFFSLLFFIFSRPRHVI